MSLFRYTFWKILQALTGTTELYNKTIFHPVSFSKKDYQEYQNNIDQLLKSASQDVEYYRQALKNKKPNFKNFPIMTRPKFKEVNKFMLSDKYRQNFKEYKLTLDNSIITNLKYFFFKKDFIFNMSTGGTSGSPLICHKNRETLFLDALLFIKGWAMMGYRPGDKVLIYYDAYYNYDISWFNIFSPFCGIKLFFFDILSKKTVHDLVKEINSFKPKIIVTFPSYINYAAKIIEEENLKITHFPQGIEVSGENLFKHQRQNTERAFKTKVYDSYGSLEIGMVAHECEHQNGLHIYEDIARLENKRQKGQNLVLATRYDTASWPIIKYQIGDLGTIIKEKCKCGRHGYKLKNIRGRVEDYIILPNKRIVYPTFFRQFLDFLNEKYNNEIIESNLVQTSSKNLTLNVVTKTKKFQTPIKNYFIAEMKEFLPQSMAIKVKFVEDIKKRRKFRFIERKIKKA